MSGDEHGKHLKPATHVIHGAYNPRWAEGAAKCPIFETSTWVFPTAEEGERFFSIVSGASQLHEGELQPSIRTERPFVRLAPPRGLAARCRPHCNTCVAPGIKAVRT